MGSSVKETASNGAESLRTPSTRLVMRLADQIREKSGPSAIFSDMDQSLTNAIAVPSFLLFLPFER